MTSSSRSLTQLPNLGQTIAMRLAEVGIRSVQQLARIGSARAYGRLCERAGRRLPLCYYLYSLEAALQGIAWTALASEEKQRLRREADRVTALTRSSR